MRKYVYDPKAFATSVTLIGVFCALICLYSVWALLQGNFLFWIFLLVGAYQVFNTFFSISNPQTVTWDEETITFSAYGQCHSYRFEEITELKIKELDFHKKLYLRVNESTLLRGRYWIFCARMNDGEELWDRLAYLEYQKEPAQLKFRTRIPKNPFETEQDTKIDS